MPDLIASAPRTSLFDGRVVLVTGSSVGIGAACARRFAAEGATVVVNSVANVEAGERVAAQLPSASYCRADIADAGEVDGLLEHVSERHGRLDLLVNNAGTTQVIPHAELDAATPEVWRRILDVNLIGTWLVTVAALPLLRSSDQGQVINVSSIAGQRTTGSSIPYACSKAAVDHLTRLLANTLGPEVRVNAVAPGLVDTPRTAEWDGPRDFVIAAAPLRRVATPDDVADVIHGVACSGYMTGEVVLVDGGMHLI
ncbi:MAG: SDR family NAD(P)-dependent oxidoreductase [Acidimicrobiales bacterium]